MLKKATCIALFAMVGLILSPSNGNAFGIGLYVPVAGAGTSTWTISSDFGDNKEDYDFTGNGGFGIVLDTKVARDGLFNYRLNIGMQNATYSYQGLDFKDFKLYVLDNSFGFGVVRTRFMRLWIGPQVRLAAMNRSKDGTDLSAFGFGLAPVIGANFNFGRMLTAAVDLGYRFTSFGGKIESSDSYGSYSNDFTIGQQAFFLNISFLFRINDVFESAYDEDEDKADFNEDYY